VVAGRLAAAVALVVATGCSDDSAGFRPLVHEQRLASGKVVKVVSCLLAWGVEHDERQDAFALEYLSTVPPGDLEREALEVFELIRPISEEWRLSLATVTALRTAERTGTYDVFVFKRSAEGAWSHSSQSITRNKA
jgi:hypothetical protein